MQPTSSRPLPAGLEAASEATAPQSLDDWAKAIALTVAATLEPSCALALCFGNYAFIGQPLPPARADR